MQIFEKNDQKSRFYALFENFDQKIAFFGTCFISNLIKLAQKAPLENRKNFRVFRPKMMS